MQPLEAVPCPSEFRKGWVYQIDGCLYQFLYSDPYARVDRPRYIFRPLPSQKRRAELILNRNNFHKAYLAPGYKASQVSEVSPKAVQMTLF